MPSASETMRAIVMQSPGVPDVLQIRDISVPELRPGHALIRVRATSVNPVDVKIRQGLPIAPADPAVLHGDVAGIVEAIAPDARESHPEDLRAGDAVYGCCGGVKGSGGALAEYMLVDARLLAKMPADLSFAEAAALLLVTITSWEALFLRAGLAEPLAQYPASTVPRSSGRSSAQKPIETILIQGGAGGVGHIAVQLARAASQPDESRALRTPRIFATASSAAKQDIVLQLGAVPIAYRESSVAQYVAGHTGGAGFDLVFDTVGGESLDASFEAVKRGAQVCAIAARSTHDLSPLHAKGATLHIIFMLQPLLFNEGDERARHGEILRKAARLAAKENSERLRPLLDEERFGFSQAARAHERYESGRASGKIVLENDL